MHNTKKPELTGGQSCGKKAAHITKAPKKMVLKFASGRTGRLILRLAPGYLITILFKHMTQLLLSVLSKDGLLIFKQQEKLELPTVIAASTERTN